MKRWVRNTLSLAFAVVFILLVTASNGGRAYFCPHTLEYVTQSELTIAGTGIPFYRSKLKPTSNELIEMLIAEGFVQPQEAPGPCRELIFHWNDSWRGGKGSLYHVLIRNRRAIISWSRTNRPCAEIYWAEGFRLLRSTHRTERTRGFDILYHCWGVDSIQELRERIAEVTKE